MRHITYYVCEWHAGMKTVPVEYDSITGKKVEVDRLFRLMYEGTTCQAFACNDHSDFRVSARLVDKHEAPRTTYRSPFSTDWKAEEERAKAEAVARVQQQRIDAEAEAYASAVVRGGLLIGLAALGAVKGGKAVHRKVSGGKKKSRR